MLPIKQELEERGFLKQYTGEELFALVDKGGCNFYLGVDPSADSMTIGNFVALMQAIHVMLRGNKCYLLVGGATGMIGSPSGKDKERENLLDEETLKKNQIGVHTAMQRVCANIEQVTGKKLDFEIVNNYDRFKDINYLQFLREVGKVMTVNRMMNKDLVRKRITDPDKFISYAEFSYMLIMGYDFYVLNRDHNVVLEVGGSDEWDGILSGIEITSKLNGNKVHGFTNNLILDSTGKKFGKSEGNALWISPEKNSPYLVYQYFMNALDPDVSRYLKLFTFLDLEEIARIQAEHDKQPELRKGQQQLAYLVCQIIFGTEAAEQAKEISKFMFADNKITELMTCDDVSLKAITKEVNGSFDTSSLIGNKPILDILVESGLCESRGDAKKLIQQGGISLNEEKLTDVSYTVTDQDRIKGKVLLLSKGKKTMRLLLK